MYKIGLFYAASAACNINVKTKLTDLAPLGKIDLCDIATVPADVLSAYSHMIIGLPLWNEDKTPDAWKGFLAQIGCADLSEKIVAFYGVGAQEGYSETFLEAMTALYDLVAKKGGIIVGSWPIDTYDFGGPSSSKEESTQLKRWVQQIAPYFFREK